MKLREVNRAPRKSDIDLYEITLDIIFICSDHVHYFAQVLQVNLYRCYRADVKSRSLIVALLSVTSNDETSDHRFIN